MQIVWLAAVERYGRNVNASILGDYWLSYIIPNWVEYGKGKANLRAGIVPPLSGDVENTYKNSNGCWIRSELWACLSPGHPEIATRYAFVVLGLLYGEGDFGKSLIIANNCGEDTDCTCATLGALFGIIYGAAALPEKWTKPLDDKIVT